ncbi:MAG: hypothetical protein ACOVRK_04570, partial [Chryseobacterium taeanense]
GLWVSEYRIESGLNCGGHAFATEGLLLGPILEEFKQKKHELVESAHVMMNKILEQKGRCTVKEPLDMKITVQGGVGTAEEHEFLLKTYDVDSIGWGSPFLLVPEATSMDNETRQLLTQAKEKDFYISNLSPLGVPFNTVKGSSNEVLRHEKQAIHRYGSSCPKKLLALSKEYSPEGTCTASKKYQDLKLHELESEKQEISPEIYQKKKENITEKACLCVGLVNAAYIENGIEIKGEKQGVVVCPGPNLAYFDKQISLSEMVKHIYGKTNVISHKARPNMFINEMKMYIDHLKNDISNFTGSITAGQIKKWKNFKENLLNGINYYENLLVTSDYFKADLNIRCHLQHYKLMVSQIVIPEN